jgi:Fic family protein
MTWIWQKKHWPDFVFNNLKIKILEDEFIHNAGMITGLLESLDSKFIESMKIDFLSDEAFKTSEIEGELLNRDSLKLSIRKNIQKVSDIDVNMRENDIAAVIIDAHNSFAAPVSHKLLCKWYKILAHNRTDLLDLTGYRKHKEAMQIISGMNHTPNIHYEAPPSENVFNEMEKFIHWFNCDSQNLTPLTRSAISHLYFVLIHPFEDCNGRISRILAEKTLVQHLKRQTIISISSTIQKNRKTYYDVLERNNRNLDITEWLEYFAGIVIESQNDAKDIVRFTIQKTKFYNKYKNVMNERQQKVVASILKRGTFEFIGGLSAEKYISITKTSRATATRDLQDMVAKGILTKTGELRHTRYQLNSNVA